MHMFLIKFWKKRSKRSDNRGQHATPSQALLTASSPRHLKQVSGKGTVRISILYAFSLNVKH